jgi:flagellar assembly protein FliH
MPEPKPYQAPDFQIERVSEERIKSQLRRTTEIALEQQKKMRRSHENKILSLKQKHKEELLQTRNESFEQGRQKGLQEGHESVLKALHDLDVVTKKLLESERAFLRNAEKHVVTLALAVSKKIIGRELKSDKDIVYHTVQEALKQVADKAKIIIRVNPEDLNNILSHTRELQMMDKNFPQLEFMGDDKIASGGCIVQTRTGSIDGRIDSQLDEIERNFMK